MNSQTKLNIAVIGQGRSGRNIHGRYFKSDQQLFNVVAVVDGIAERRQRAHEEYGCDVYSDYRELFSRKDIDVVVNSTFSYQHASVAEDLLLHGFNVVSEKPFARTVEECDRIIAAEKSSGKMLAVFQQSRFVPYYKKIKEIIASGKLGRLIQISVAFSGFARRWDWQCSRRFGGGNVQNTGPHPLDQVLDLLGGTEIPEVFSRLDTVNTSGDAEDYAKIILTIPGKPLVDVEISSCDAFSSFTYKIQGSNGTLLSTQHHISLKYFKPEDEPVRELILSPLSDENGYPVYCSEKLNWYTEEYDILGDAFVEATSEFYSMVYDHLLYGKELSITPEQIRRQIAVDDIIFAQNPLPVKY